MPKLDRAVREYLALLALAVAFSLIAPQPRVEVRPGRPLRTPSRPRFPGSASSVSPASLAVSWSPRFCSGRSGVVVDAWRRVCHDERV
jgi:hypothetical protein